MRKKNQLEKSLIRAETSFLMTQFNPHFLFNVLSYMYSKASRISDDLSNAIELLAEIMRYSLKDTNPSDRVSLADEWDHIENFIELNRLRFDNEIFVELNVNGDMLSKKIIPLILISLVENAFKHGKINDPKHPLYMTLSVDYDGIQFEIKNRKKNGKKDPRIKSLGIGNENVRKRLELAYGSDFEQIIEEDEHTYNYKLLIKEKSYAMPNY
ncbi:MAG: histidine kinase [Bacteroidota bacterium]